MRMHACAACVHACARACVVGPGLVTVATMMMFIVRPVFVCGSACVCVCVCMCACTRARAACVRARACVSGLGLITVATPTLFQRSIGVTVRTHALARTHTHMHTRTGRSTHIVEVATELYLTTTLYTY